MIVTVTLNTAIDHTILVPDFSLGQTIRSSQAFMGPGGKGTDASFILSTLGIRTRALGFAAGIYGKKLEEMLVSRGSETDFVWVNGETRLNTIVVCSDGSGQTTFTVESLEPNAPDLQLLITKLSDCLPSASGVLIGGNPPRQVPPQTLADLVALCRRWELPVVLDASGQALQAAVEARPTLIKPNLHELAVLVGKPLRGLVEARDAAEAVLGQHGCSVVVTLGAEGALAITAERSYRIWPLELEAVSTAGAGDAVSAGLAHSYSQGLPIEAGLRLGFAAAGAVVLTPVTADCRPEDVERLLPRVRITPLE